MKDEEGSFLYQALSITLLISDFESHMRPVTRERHAAFWASRLKCHIDRSCNTPVSISWLNFALRLSTPVRSLIHSCGAQRPVICRFRGTPDANQSGPSYLSCNNRTLEDCIIPHVIDNPFSINWASTTGGTEIDQNYISTKEFASPRKFGPTQNCCPERRLLWTFWRTLSSVAIAQRSDLINQF